MSPEQVYRSVKDYYAILGVSDRDSREEMRHALGQPAMKYHPDRNPGNEELAGGSIQGDQGCLCHAGRRGEAVGS